MHNVPVRATGMEYDGSGMIVSLFTFSSKALGFPKLNYLH